MIIVVLWCWGVNAGKYGGITSATIREATLHDVKTDKVDLHDVKADEVDLHGVEADEWSSMMPKLK